MPLTTNLQQFLLSKHILINHILVLTTSTIVTTIKSQIQIKKDADVFIAQTQNEWLTFSHIKNKTLSSLNREKSSVTKISFIFIFCDF